MKKPKVHLEWVEEDYFPPNPNYHCKTYTFYVLGNRVAAIFGPSVAEPQFTCGRTKFDSLDVAKAHSLDRFRRSTSSQINTLRSMFSMVSKYIDAMKEPTPLEKVVQTAKSFPGGPRAYARASNDLTTEQIAACFDACSDEEAQG